MELVVGLAVGLAVELAVELAVGLAVELAETTFGCNNLHTTSLACW